MNALDAGPTTDSKRCASPGAPSVTVQSTCTCTTSDTIKNFTPPNQIYLPLSSGYFNYSLTWVSPREKSDDPCKAGKLPASLYTGLTSSRRRPSTLAPSFKILLRTIYKSIILNSTPKIKHIKSKNNKHKKKGNEKLSSCKVCSYWDE